MKNNLIPIALAALFLSAMVANAATCTESGTNFINAYNKLYNSFQSRQGFENIKIGAQAAREALGSFQADCGSNLTEQCSTIITQTDTLGGSFVALVDSGEKNISILSGEIKKLLISFKKTIKTCKLADDADSVNKGEKPKKQKTTDSGLTPQQQVCLDTKQGIVDSFLKVEANLRVGDLAAVSTFSQDLTLRTQSIQSNCRNLIDSECPKQIAILSSRSKRLESLAADADTTQLRDDLFRSFNEANSYCHLIEKTEQNSANNDDNVKEEEDDVDNNTETGGKRRRVMTEEFSKRGYQMNKRDGARRGMAETPEQIPIPVKNQNPAKPSKNTNTVSSECQKAQEQFVQAFFDLRNGFKEHMGKFQNSELYTPFVASIGLAIESCQNQISDECAEGFQELQQVATKLADSVKNPSTQNVDIELRNIRTELFTALKNTRFNCDLMRFAAAPNPHRRERRL